MWENSPAGGRGNLGGALMSVNGILLAKQGPLPGLGCQPLGSAARLVVIIGYAITSVRVPGNGFVYRIIKFYFGPR